MSAAQATVSCVSAIPELILTTIMRPLGNTGVQTHLQAVLHQAPRNGVVARLVSPFDAGLPLIFATFGPGRVAELFSKAAYVWWHYQGHYLLLCYRLWRRLRRTVPAVVYAQDPLSARAALDMRARGYPVEVVLAVHFNISQADEWAEGGYIRRSGRVFEHIARIEREVLPAVDRLIYPSQYMLEQIATRIPAARSVPTWCIPNCVDDIGTPAPVPLQGDLLTIGTLEPRKNQEFLLHVLAECHRAGHRYRLAIVGGGPSRSRLQGLARELGLAEHVHFLGEVAGAAVLIPGYRAYVHSARLENLPITLIEALAAGRPLFAPPVGGVPEVFADGVEGRYWELGDPRGAARLLVAVLEDPPLYERLSRAARARYESHFTPGRIVPKLLQAIFGGRHHVEAS